MGKLCYVFNGGFGLYNEMTGHVGKAVRRVTMSAYEIDSIQVIYICEKDC